MTKVVIFEDAEETLKQYRAIFSKADASIQYYRSSRLQEEELQEIKLFKPQLIIVDLLMGNSKMDGYALIRKLQSDSTLRHVPIIVASKFINSSPYGLSETAEASSSPGVVAAISKIPTLPQAAQAFLQFARPQGQE